MDSKTSSEGCFKLPRSDSSSSLYSDKGNSSISKSLSIVKGSRHILHVYNDSGISVLNTQL